MKMKLNLWPRSNIQIFSAILLIICKGVDGELKMSRLFKDLMRDYDKNIRPARNFSEVVTVTVNLKLIQVVELNFHENWMRSRVAVEQEWIDFQLQWSPSSYDYITEFVIPANFVWLPDLTVYNDAEGKVRLLPTKVRIHRSGRISSVTSAIIKTQCDLDMSRFPYDSQNCYFKLGSWTFDGFKLDLRHRNEVPHNGTIPSGVDLSAYYRNTEWSIPKVSAVRHEKYYNCCKEPYIDIFFELTLQRRPLSHICMLIFPWIIFTCLPVFTFLLPAKSNLKIPYSMFLLILLLATFAVSGDQSNFPLFLMKRHYIFTTVIVALTMLSAVLILNVESRKDEPVPQCVRNIAKTLSDYVLLKWQDQRPGSTAGTGIDDATTDNVDTNQHGLLPETKAGPDAGQVTEWEQVAHVLDRLLFGIFLLACIIGIVIILI